MRPVIRWTLWHRRFSTLWWSMGIVVYIVLITSVYHNFIHAQGSHFGQTINQLPDTIKSFTNIGSDFNTSAGFLGSEPYYVVLPIIFIVLAIGLGGWLLASEERDGTLELLLGRPLSRGRLLSAKATVGILILAAVNVITGAVMTLSTRVFNMDVSVGRLWQVQLLLLLLSMIFGALAFMLTAAGRMGRGAAVGVSALLALGGYILTSLESLVSWLVWPARLLPYHYYHPADVLKGAYSWKVAISYLVVILVAGIISWSAFRRRDIT